MKKDREFETDFCDTCQFLDKECEMRIVRDVPFDEDMLEYFPNVPFPAEDIYKYKGFKLKALPVKLDDKFIPMLSSTYRYDESTIAVPITSLKLNSKYKKDCHISFPRAKQVGLVMSAKDEFLLKFIEADDIDGGEWAVGLRNKNFDFVLSPQISFYYNQPSCSTVYNRLLTYKSIKELIDAGIPTIPQIGFLWEKDLKDYIKWLVACKFQYAYINLQQVKYDSEFEISLETVRMLDKLVGDKFEIIVLGVFSIDRIKQLEKIRPFKYINTSLHILSTLRVEWKNGKERKLNEFDAMYYEDVMKNNLFNYRKALQKASVI